MSEGIYFWRPDLLYEDLPLFPLPSTMPFLNTPNAKYCDLLTRIHSIVDSDLAANINHKKIISGILFWLVAWTILYKTKYQECIATNLAYVEFTATYDAGKVIPYVRCILDEIDKPQDEVTPLYIDNNGSLIMGSVQEPTSRRTKS